MYVISGKTFSEVYKKAIIEILGKGDEVAPRGSKTYELSPATITIENPRQLLTMPRLRKGNYTFQLAEALWMLRGSNDLAEISHYNRVWNNFEDEDVPGILNGAYGERLRAWQGTVDQFAAVYSKLSKDEFSRQATMIIFDPERDNAIHQSGNYSKDIPCTNMFNFTIRDGKLNMLTIMRSNDLHKGSIYDIPNFIIFQHILAGWLGVEVGKYEHVAASLHIYETDVENFIDIYNDNEDIEVYEDGVDYGDPRMTLDEFNKTMFYLSTIEFYTRIATKEDFDKLVEPIIKDLEQIENTWWKSVAAQLALYNYRKVGAAAEEFNQFLPFITNEYRKSVENVKPITKITAS